MDREQFDALTRLVAATGSRRVALAGLLGAVLHSLGLQPTAAQCRAKEGKHKRQCRRHHRDAKAPGGLFPCQDKLFGLCLLKEFEGSECCNNMTCTITFNPFVTACQFPCETDDDCKRKFPNKALVCRQDHLVCPLEAKCCVAPA
jgi:hypothetical protein